ncbi:MAG: hypothetical protein Q8P25_05110 [Candidatus Curtissbacteria bacterium]|nr:hypothetical protein [Candidatus Curtissbacteria bacterium]MDZ4210028.1 hypothetical protein [Candidatus Curtissbacteria bacterium]
MTDEIKNAEYQQAIAQLDVKTAQELPKTSTVGYLLWSLAIPPITTFWVMYSAWKKGVLYKLMPNMIIVYSILFGLWSMLMFSASGAFSSYLNQQVASAPGFDKIMAIILTVGGISSGIYFRVKGKKEGTVSLIWISLMTVILLLQVYAGVHQLSFVSAVVTKAQDINIGM